MNRNNQGFGMTPLRNGVSTAGFQTVLWLSLVVCVVFLFGSPGVVEAQGGGALEAPKLPTDAGSILAKVIVFFKSFAKVGLVGIVLVSFLVAAYSGVTGLVRFATGKGEWGGSLMIFLFAILATVIVGQIAFDGFQVIDKLGG